MSDLKNFLKTTPRYIELLEQAGIKTIKDFLEYFPRTYEQRDAIKTLDMPLDESSIMTFRALIISKKVSPRPGGKQYAEIACQDPLGNQATIYLRQINYQRSVYEPNKRYLITGKPKRIGRKITFWHPNAVPTTPPPDTSSQETESWSEHYFVWRIVPIYSEIQGIKPDRFAKRIRAHRDLIQQYCHEYLPVAFLSQFDLRTVPETIDQLHFPDSRDHKDQALHRLFFDRLLRMQIHALMTRQQYQSSVSLIADQPNRELIKHITSQLPFQLTHAQKKCISEIINDISGNKPMMRLLQGDVGSGKTIVAAICAYYLIKQQHGQIALLAPLEILAQQHHRSLAKILLPLGIRIQIITWSLSKSQKEQIKSDLKNGSIDIIVGTHALIQADIGFHDLKMVIIDEQHKFGVQQRSFFKQFNSPHILQMSATPIPRSLALAFFGEFDVSVIDQMPAGRKPIITKIISEHERHKLKPRIINKIEDWQKVFMVTPLIEDSEELENLKSAFTQFEHIKNLYSDTNIQIGLMHGKLKSKEKEHIMNQFKTWNIQILIATTVIEVGVDIPEATIMVIYNAERFGLSQLHQLRGRIGRNDLQSYCFLETRSKSWTSYQRLKAMEDTTDGFKLAQIDLQYRGSGEILWIRQSGQTDIPLEIISDTTFVQKAKNWAERILENYPGFEWLDKLKDFMNSKIHTLLS